jgi:hypothetical protein
MTRDEATGRAETFLKNGRPTDQLGQLVLGFGYGMAAHAAIIAAASSPR